MIKVLIIKTLFFISLVFCNISFAAISTPVVTDQSSLSLVVGGYVTGSVSAGLHYKLKPGWKIYWRDAGDTGYPPQLDWNGSENIKSTEFHWPAPERLRSKLTEELFSESYGYGGEVLFPISIVPENASKPIKISVHVNYAICKDICIPAEADLVLDIPLAYNSVKDSLLIGQYQDLTPHENGYNGVNISRVELGQRDSGDKYLQITVDSKERSLKGADIFVEGGEDFALYNPTASISKDGLLAVFNAPITYLTNSTSIVDKEFKVTLANGKESVELVVSGDKIGKVVSALPIEKAVYTIWLILLLGFCGGLILNVMPCVLPVLSIKLLGVIKYGGGDRAHVATSFVVTALGIISSFIGLGVLVAVLRSAGMNVGWGFHFQEPLFIIGLVVVLTFFAANMWGLYEFRMPVGIGGAAYKKSEQHSLLGHFLTGIFATILATPCTAPFLGTAVGFALSRGPFDIVLIFAVMGLGMSAPYLVFSLFPGIVTKLPKPGVWMVVVKHIMGLLLAIAAVWLIWVLSNQLGKTAAVILAVLSLAKLLKMWAANHISFLAKKSVRIVVLGGIVLLAFVLPLRFSAVEEQQSYEEGGLWEEFRRDDIQLLVEHGKVVFVDVTADWCLTCKVNKFLVFDSYEVKEVFRAAQIVAMRADWTNKSDYIADYMMSHNRVGIPFNIVYGPGAPDGIILSELLNKKDVIKAIGRAQKK